MALDVNGTNVETTEEGYLVDASAWTEDFAKAVEIALDSFITN